MNIISNDSLQVKNEKTPLSVDGEKKALELSLDDEMKDIDVVISSNYVRAISSAKYIAYQNKINLDIIEDFGERKYGIDSWDEKPKDFDKLQIDDENFKMPNGESRKETAERMYDALTSVLERYNGKRIAIVSHGTAITYLFMKMFKSDGLSIKFNDEVLMDKNFVWKAPEVFKLIFDNNELVSICNLEIDRL